MAQPHDDVKLIAFYLPQFHPIPENDRWWGRGFTEWTNVTAARPVFDGHYQPHLPSELGFYDLRVPEVREQQAELARAHGIHGFCYYHYWFGGRRLLERPFDEMLRTGRPDFPFCVCWANENWTRRWDGAEHEVLIAQAHSDGDDGAFIRALLPAFRDPRYIRVGERPLLIVYRAPLLPDMPRTLGIWARECRRAGLPPPFVLAALTFNLADPRPLGVDGAIEFPPHGSRVAPLAPPPGRVDPDFQGTILDYGRLARQFLRRSTAPFRRFRTVVPGWDNTPRRRRRGVILHGSTPERYAAWLAGAVRETYQRHPPGERLVFINAWNEWGEGAHLEPDRRFGRAYLEATRDALRRARAPQAEGAPPAPRAPDALVADLSGVLEILSRQQAEIDQLRRTLAAASPNPRDLRRDLVELQASKARAIQTLADRLHHVVGLRELWEDSASEDLDEMDDARPIGPVTLQVAQACSRQLDRVPALKRLLRSALTAWMAGRRRRR